MSPRLALRRVRCAKARRKAREERVAIAKSHLDLAYKSQDIYWMARRYWEEKDPEREAQYEKRIANAAARLQEAYAS